MQGGMHACAGVDRRRGCGAVNYLPGAIVADAVEPHNGGLVPALWPHHVRPAVLPADAARTGGAHRAN